MAPVEFAALRPPGSGPAMPSAPLIYLCLAAILGGCLGPAAVGQKTAAPAEPRQGTPALPAQLEIYGKHYALAKLENPVRMQLLAQWKTEPEQAMQAYAAAVQAGTEVFYTECVHCHGDHLDGQGMFSLGLDPAPPNFREAGALSRLREAYLFWRITTGGAGLPRENAPWESTMPDYQAILNEAQVWNVITFLYDRVGQVPSLPDAASNMAMAALRDQVQTRRAELRGMDLYQHYCVVCHGETGAGDGVAAKVLYPAPRDLSVGVFKYQTTIADVLLPTDDDLFNTIKAGLPRTAMPEWGVVLSDEQIRSLIPVVKGFDTIGNWAPEDAPDEDFDDDGYYTGSETLSAVDRLTWKQQVPFSEESVATGRSHFEKNCTPCHGDEGRGSPSVEKKLRDDWGARIWPRDLTKPWTWRVTNVPESREQTIRNIFTRLSVGIPGTPMPEHASAMTEEDRWHMANYEYTLRETTPPLSTSRVIQGLSVDGPLPESVNDAAWSSAAPVTTLMLLPNLGKGERLFKPLNDSMSVRVLYNEQEIAFLLEMDDRTNSLPGDPDAEKIKDPDLTLYPDAFAVQFPKKAAFTVAPAVEKPLFRHGDSAHPTTIWYWNAGSVEPAVAPYTRVLDGAGIEQELRVRAGDSGLAATGEWLNGRWRVLLKRRRDGGAGDDLAFSEGRFLPVSFANWDGSNDEIGSKHMLSAWHWLVLGAADKAPEKLAARKHARNH